MDDQQADQQQGLIESLRRIDSPTVSNAIEAFNVRDCTDGFASSDIRCAFPELGPLVGYAVTCTSDSTTGGPRRPSRLGDLIDLIAAAPRPAVIVCQYVGADRTRGCFIGDLMASFFSRVGAIGIVTDVPNRDLPVLHERAPGFHVFGPGSVASHGNPAIIDVDIPVSIGGMRVRPGDLLHADASGVLTVPLSIAGDVAAQAERVWAAEQQTYALIRDVAASIEEVKSRFGH
jgi:regulator of RNase E activity RraA